MLSFNQKYSYQKPHRRRDPFQCPNLIVQSHTSNVRNLLKSESFDHPRIKLTSKSDFKLSRVTWYEVVTLPGSQTAEEIRGFGCWRRPDNLNQDRLINDTLSPRKTDIYLKYSESLIFKNIVCILVGMYMSRY